MSLIILKTNFKSWIILMLATIHGISTECEPGWQAVGQTYCYRIGDAMLTWAAATSECNKLDSMLLRPYDQYVVQDVKQLLATSNDTRWWTGLNDISNPQIWVWDTGMYASQVEDPSIFNWIREPDDTKHLQNCAALNEQGSLTDERCSDRYRYICEYPMQGGSCLSGWLNFSGGCYLFPAGLGDPWSMLKWTDANQKCQTVLQGMTGAQGITPHLLFIETQAELNYIRYQLPLISLTSEIWWIGLTDNQTEGQFKWTDGRPIGSLAFWASEWNNLGAKERCVYTNSVGSMADFNCNKSVSYICQKENDVSSVVLPGLGCPSSWTRAGRYCYHFETTQRESWADARSICKSAGADLIKVDSFDKKSWVEAQNAMFDSGLWYWTGLNYQQAKTWRWADNSPANLTLVKWNAEPNNYKGNEACTIIRKSGKFNDVNCLIQAGYVCEYNSEDAPCSSGWLSQTVGDFTNCYYIGTDLATYDEAHARCNQQSAPFDSFLLAINTQDELTFVAQSLSAVNTMVEEFYTGLTDAGHEGLWTYDTSFNPMPADGLIPWSKSPDFPKGNENCATIIFAGSYINVACTDLNPYICEKLAYGVASKGSRLFTKFSVSSVFVLAAYFLVYGLCLHYILHVSYVLFPAFA
ncbi:C-type mannose receptor 2-like [Mya arenaria]|uniref:C-type mannose receptor 2-like n=1 Tax=Mya arenaria TaxID=6604 RepID=UPI0022E86E2E|nr:C-type mannose receptor 2-like [Mya arenaria]